MNKFSKAISSLFVDGIVVFSMVLVFSGTFLGLINNLFPPGVLMSSIFNSSQQFEAPISYDNARKIRLFHASRESSFSPEYSAASLEKKKNVVKSKRANAISWKHATKGMPLYDHDALQTYSKSSAFIRFDPENTIEMRENSLIVIRKLEKDFIFKEKRAFIVVADGEFRGKFFSTPGKPVFVELETPTAVARITPSHSSNEPVDFKVKINPDSSSTFIVYTGQAEIESHGQKISLSSRQKTYVGIEKAPIGPLDLSAPIDLFHPDNEKTFLYSKLPPAITFSWRKSPTADGYFLEISKSPNFEGNILEAPTLENNFTLGNLQAGTYYWRVSSLAGRDDEIFSDSRAIHVFKDTVPPKLTVNFPEEEIVDTSLVTITGQTDPDATLYIINKQVQLSESGAFRYELKLKEGINVVVVEAIDEVGNVAYKTKYLDSKF